jgi:hypothetical protein
MMLLAGSGEEGRRIYSRSTRRPSIVQLPTITITVYLVGGWMINNNLEWRRTAISLAQEEERTKQRRPRRGPAQKMEPHRIARSRRPMRSQRSVCVSGLRLQLG